VSYTRDTTNDGSTPPDYDTGSSLVDHGDGTYTFTFNTDVANVTGVTHEPTLSHRVAGQIGSRSVPLEPQNLFLDFVPAGGDVTETRNIAVMDSCNECHDGLVFHGRRFITQYCVNCHNPDLAEGEGDFKYMIHRIHSAQAFDVLGLRDDSPASDYSELTFPGNLPNCRKCHNGEDEATPDGDNWKNVPNMVACGSCHEISFVDPPPEGLTLHSGGVQANNSLCASCHPASGGLSGVEDVHLTENATPNNPSVASGLANISYEITEARVDGSGVLEIDFSILRDGVPMDILNLPADLTDPGRFPSFVLGYAAGPQDGIVDPNDYNNFGRTAGQPQSASLGNLIDGGSVSDSGTEGVYTATVADAFPDGAAMRVVALQSYFRQRVILDPDVGEEDVARHSISVVQPVTGNALRRVIIDPNKCGNCHEWLELHGGSRVLGAGSDPDQPPVCVICHNPNLSSSGRTADPAEPLRDDTVEALGDDPLIYPERSMHFKNLIHGIHAAGRRNEEFEFVRNRQNGIYYNFGEVTFPGILNNCLTCHVEGSYELPLPDGVLMSTERTTTGDPENRDDILGARDTVPNGTDLVNTPTASTCYQCHDSELAVAHMEQNGGQINVLLREEHVVGADFVVVGADALTRDEVLAGGATESCAICHGSDRVADLNLMHGIEYSEGLQHYRC
ncbi:MAG: OmcA/MtrC family decaheme c-type cytochrome, partial [Acidimicrobiia bacterium]